MFPSIAAGFGASGPSSRRDLLAQARPLLQEDSGEGGLARARTNGGSSSRKDGRASEAACRPEATWACCSRPWRSFRPEAIVGRERTTRSSHGATSERRRRGGGIACLDLIGLGWWGGGGLEARSCSGLSLLRNAAEQERRAGLSRLRASERLAGVSLRPTLGDCPACLSACCTTRGWAAGAGAGAGEEEGCAADQVCRRRVSLNSLQRNGRALVRCCCCQLSGARAESSLCKAEPETKTGPAAARSTGWVGACMWKVESGGLPRHCVTQQRRNQASLGGEGRGGEVWPGSSRLLGRSRSFDVEVEARRRKNKRRN